MSKISQHKNTTSTLIVFEIGPTLYDLQSALKLVEAAVEANADAIKFQYFDVDKLVADKSIGFTYRYLDKETHQLLEKTESLHSILSRRCLLDSEWSQICTYALSNGLEVYTTVCFESDIQRVLDWGATSLKLASADINHLPLIKAFAESGVPIQIDTGNARLDEIAEAVTILRKYGCADIVIHHCPSGYPADPENIHLNKIRTIKTLYPDCSVAYSDHSPDCYMDFAAIPMGASIVEKTITLDRYIVSPEHAMSLEPYEMNDFVEKVRSIDLAFGAPFEFITDEQLSARSKVNRSVHAKTFIQKGQDITEDLIEYRRPGFGISPAKWFKITNECTLAPHALEDISAGSIIYESNIENA